MPDLPSKLKDLIEDFKLVTDKNQRMDMLIYYAEDFKEVPPEIATKPYSEEHRVPACESDAYVWSELQEDGGLRFYFAVNNPQGISAKAMAAILTETVSGLTPDEIVGIEPDIVYQLFGRNMSMGKSAGLTSMVSVVKSHALQSLNGS